MKFSFGTAICNCSDSAGTSTVWSQDWPSTRKQPQLPRCHVLALLQLANSRCRLHRAPTASFGIRLHRAVCIDILPPGFHVCLPVFVCVLKLPLSVWSKMTHEKFLFEWVRNNCQSVVARKICRTGSRASTVGAPHPLLSKPGAGGQMLPLHSPWGLHVKPGSLAACTSRGFGLGWCYLEDFCPQLQASQHTAEGPLLFSRTHSEFLTCGPRP